MECNHRHQLKPNQLIPHANTLNINQMKHDNYLNVNGRFLYQGVTSKTQQQKIITIRNEIQFKKSQKTISIPLVDHIPEHYAIYDQEYKNKLLQTEIEIFKQFHLQMLLDIGLLRQQNIESIIQVDQNLQHEAIILAGEFNEKEQLLKILVDNKSYKESSRQMEIYQLKQQYKELSDAQLSKLLSIEKEIELVYSEFLQEQKIFNSNKSSIQIQQDKNRHLQQLIKMNETEITKILDQNFIERFKIASKISSKIENQISIYQNLSQNIVNSLENLKQNVLLSQKNFKILFKQFNIDQVFSTFYQINDQVQYIQYQLQEITAKISNVDQFIDDQQKLIQDQDEEFLKDKQDLLEINNNISDAREQIQQSINEINRLEQEKIKIEVTQTQIDQLKKYNLEIQQKIIVVQNQNDSH